MTSSFLDADETLMDFPDAEHQALVRTFEDHHLTLTPSIDQLYQQINSGLWKQFEQQLITRKQLLSTRFAQLFDTLGITGIDSENFNREYLFNLGYGSKTMPYAQECCQQLYQAGCRLYIPDQRCRRYPPPSGCQRSDALLFRRLCIGGKRLSKTAEGIF